MMLKFYFVALAFAAFFILAGCSKVVPPESKEQLTIDYSVSLISNNLVSPLTAKFSGAFIQTNEEKNVLLVFGKVDSQNRFGALIRSDFTCVLTNPTPQSLDWLIFSIGDDIPTEN